MKTLSKKFLPFLLIIIGCLRLFAERFSGKFAFLRSLASEPTGWLFWTVGIAGLIWLILQQSAFSETENPRSEQAKGSPLQQFFRNYGIEMLILLLTAASLSMLIRSGYFWDDAVNSTAYLAEKKDSIPTLTHVLTFMRRYLELGRINVLSFYYYFFFYIENVSVYKGLIILTILMDQLIFRKVLMEFGVSRSGARLGMLLIPLLLQTRAYQDPVSGFYSLMQVLTAEMLLSALFLNRWLKGGKKRHLFLSLTVFTFGLLTYEVCFPFLAMIFLLIWNDRKSFFKAVRDALPFIGVTVLLLGAVYLVRNLFFRVEYPGVAFSLEPARILRAALTQLGAGLPLSFYTAHYQAAVMDNAYPANSFMNYDFLSLLKAIRLSDILIVVTAFYILKKIFRYPLVSGPEASKKPVLLILGFSFAVLPMITVAMSERYQGQLMPGLGYLPVYMQYYGIAVLILCLVSHCKQNRGLRALFLSAFMVILLLNLQNNRAVTKIMNRSFYEPRNAGEAALWGGILDFLPPDAVLVSVNDRRYLWEADWNNNGLYPQFYGNNARRIPATVGDTKLLQEAVNAAETAGHFPNEEGFLRIEPENVWLIEYSGGPGRGFARLGRLVSAEIDPESLALRAAETDKVLYFISGDFPEQDSVQYTTDGGTFRQIEITQQHRIRQNTHGLLFQLPEDEVIFFNSLMLTKR